MSRHRNLRRVFGRVLLPLVAVQIDAFCQDDPKLELPKISLWNTSIDAHVHGGYKDNVLLGNQNTVGSPFVGGGVDALFWRLPVDGWEALVIGSVEYSSYTGTQEVDKEATVITQAQVKRSFGDGWKAGLGLEYFFFDQVFDNSVFDFEFSSLRVQGQSYTVRPLLRKELSQGWFGELEAFATREMFEEAVDDEWQGGAKLTLGRSLKHGSEISLSYQFTDRQFDTREPRTEEGLFQTGRSLEFFQNEVSALWRQNWDADRHWRTVTRASFQRTEDNGNGFYSYDRTRFSQQIRYQNRGWEITLNGKLSHYSYAQQPLSLGETATRERTILEGSLRVEKAVWKSVKLFAEYEHEHSIANVSIERYSANMIMIGAGVDF